MAGGLESVHWIQKIHHRALLRARRHASRLLRDDCHDEFLRKSLSLLSAVEK